MLDSEYTPTGLLWQTGPLIWVLLPVSSQNISLYPVMVANLITLRLKTALRGFGVHPQTVIVPYMAKQIEILVNNN